MEFIKKQSIGFYLTIISILLAGVGVGAYLVNCQTRYFMNLGVDTKVVTLMFVGILSQLIFIVGSEVVGSKKYFDILPVVSAVVFVIAFITFVSLRINGIASIITFENNAQTMADLSSALVGIVCCLLAVVSTIIASFFDIVKG